MLKRPGKKTSEQSVEKKVLNPEGNDVFMSIGEVVVYGEKEADKLAGSVDVIGEERISESDAVQALDLLRKIPGVTIMNYNFAGVPNGFTLRGWYLPHWPGCCRIRGRDSLEQLYRQRSTAPLI